MSGSASILPAAIETIPAALAFWAAATPHAPALRAVDGRQLTFGELLAAVSAVAARLRAEGVRPDDRIVLLLSPGLDETVATLGAMVAATAVPLSPATAPPELARMLRRLATRLVVAGPATPAPLAAIVAAAGAPVVPLGSLLERPGNLPDAATRLPIVAPEDPAVILHTSGTTGDPKRVPQPHRSFVAAARAASCRLGLRPDDALLLTAGLHTIAGAANLLTALCGGGSCLVSPGFDPAAVPTWFARYRPSWMATTVTELTLLLAAMAGSAAAGRDGPGPRPRFVLVGSQPVTPATIARAERALNCPVLEIYGMVEATCIAWSGPTAADRRPWSCGRPLAAEVRLRDAAGHDLPTGVTGEIVVRGPTLFPGYLDDPAANAAAFAGDGSFRTGDVGYRDEDGFLFLTGRIKEQINRGGEKIAPAEVDRALLGHPALAEAACFAVPDTRYGEDIVAAVVVAPGMSITARELRRCLLAQLAPAKVPRRIWIVAALPRTATGKVRRGELARWWRERRR